MSCEVDLILERMRRIGCQTFSVAQGITLGIADDPEPYVIDQLLPANAIALLHAQPRDFKSLISMEMALAAASGTPAFQCSRFEVSRPVPTMYLSGEDTMRRVLARFRALARGRGMSAVPPTLYCRCTQSDQLLEQHLLVSLRADAKAYGVRLFILDPLRCFTRLADQGPSELSPLSTRLRQFLWDTGATLLINHHDVKPGTIRSKNRRDRPNLDGSTLQCGPVFPDAPRRKGSEKPCRIPATSCQAGQPISFLRLATLTYGKRRQAGRRGFLTPTAEQGLAARWVNKVDDPQIVQTRQPSVPKTSDCWTHQRSIARAENSGRKCGLERGGLLDP
jgi:hypothetical protein